MVKLRLEVLLVCVAFLSVVGNARLYGSYLLGGLRENGSR